MSKKCDLKKYDSIDYGIDYDCSGILDCENCPLRDVKVSGNEGKR